MFPRCPTPVEDVRTRIEPVVHEASHEFFFAVVLLADGEEAVREDLHPQAVLRVVLY